MMRLALFGAASVLVHSYLIKYERASTLDLLYL